MPSDHPQPSFVLVRPQMGENIGAAARAMWNFSLDRMRLVAPRDGWPNPKADAMASGAGRLLDEAQLFETTADAVADCTYVFATTARQRGLTKPAFSPEGAMKLARANAVINVPVNPEFGSLNLAQCVLLIGYEWQRQVGTFDHERVEMAKTVWASQGESEALAKHYEDRLSDAGFFYPPEKVDSMKVNLRNMWSRMPLTKADVQMLHGVLRQMVRWKEKDTNKP